MQSCKILTIFGALVILAQCMPSDIGKRSFRYNPNSIEENEKILKLFLRLAVCTSNRLIRLRNQIKHSKDDVMQDAHVVKTESSPAVRFYGNDTKDTIVRDLPDEQKIVINENSKDSHEDDKDPAIVPRILVERSSEDGNNVIEPAIGNRSLFSISKHFYVTHYNDHLPNTDDHQRIANQLSKAGGKSKLLGALSFDVSIGKRVRSNKNTGSKLKSGILAGGLLTIGSNNAESNSGKNVAASQLNYEATKGNAVLGDPLEVNGVNNGETNINKNINVNIVHHDSGVQKRSGKVASSVEIGDAEASVNRDEGEELDETISESKIDELAMKFIDTLRSAGKKEAGAQWAEVAKDSSGSSGNQITQKKNDHLVIDLQGTQSRKSQSSGAIKYPQHRGNVWLEIRSHNEDNNVASSAMHKTQAASAPIIILQDSRRRSELSNNQNDHSWNSKHAATIVNSHESPVIVRRENGEFQRTILGPKYPDEYQNSIKFEKNVGLQIGPLRQTGHFKTEGKLGVSSNE